jgi:homotetrameric cytidine deaminase
LAGSDKRQPGGADDRRKGDRRSGRHRRSGKDRRTTDAASVENDRRSGRERRTGERRSGLDRRAEGWQAVGLDAPTDDPALEAVLVEAALGARERAHAPFSHFKVGAALETAAGDIITGCNVENATYGLTMCAERVAIFKAVSEGHREFARVAVVADTASSCGSSAGTSRSCSPIWTA